MPSRRLEFFATTLVFHLIFTWSIFDIYFRSPVVHPTPRFAVDAAQVGPAPAQRVVLFVADGLRADTLFKAHEPARFPMWAQADLVAQNASGEYFQGTFPSAFTRNVSTEEKAHVDDAFAAPYLHGIAAKSGTYGVSHTRVPTESRPGHVALLAGMYEDISAVTRGWKVNPIAFDSVLNQSAHTYAFGSPDIVPMFALGTPPGRVDAAVYDEDAEDFTKDAVELDVWVLDELRALLDRARADPVLDAQLRAPHTFFFLHLLGLDTTGHTYGPHSAEYVGNTIVVDAITHEVEDLFRAYFADERTAYILTADHGMSKRGNHGDGDPDNTRTPIVAWGAGVPRPKRAASYDFPEENYYEDWDLDAIARHDIEQADIAPLLATWLGVPMPANSEGQLPLAYVDVDPAYAAHAARANAEQVLEVYRVKHDQLAARMSSFVPYAPLDGDSPGADLVASIAQRIDDGEYDEALEECAELIHLALQGAMYLHKYDARTLMAIVVLGYIGVLLYGTTFLLHYALDDHVAAYQLQWAPVSVVVGASAYVVHQFVRNGSPLIYFVYAGACSAVWMLVALRAHVYGVALARASAQRLRAGVSERAARMQTLARVGLYAIVLLALLEVAAYGYLHRVAWALLLLGSMMWPFTMPRNFQNAHELALLVWIVCAASSVYFMVKSTEKEESITQLVLSGLLFFVVGAALWAWPTTFFQNADYLGRDKKVYTRAMARSEEQMRMWEREPNEDTEDPVDFLPRTRQALGGQLVLLLVACATTASSAYSLRSKQGLPLGNQVLGWLVLALSLTMPFAVGFQRPRAHDGQTYAQPKRQRLILLVYAVAPVFVLLSLRDEVFFLFVYTVLVLTWAHFEAELARHRAIAANTPRPAPRGMILDDVRVGVFYFLLLHVGFFGTGNIASISSFYLSPVYRLLPVFSPFWMAALLVLKLIVPFVFLSGVLATLCIEPTEGRAYPPETDRVSILASGLGVRDVYIPLTAAALAGDVLALNFFFAIRDTGSWLEIGQSITHFVMANLMQMYMLVIAALAAHLIGARTATGSP